MLQRGTTRRALIEHFEDTFTGKFIFSTSIRGEPFLSQSLSSNCSASTVLFSRLLRMRISRRGSADDCNCKVPSERRRQDLQIDRTWPLK